MAIVGVARQSSIDMSYVSTSDTYFYQHNALLIREEELTETTTHLGEEEDVSMASWARAAV